jgi:5-methyltetrahydrofolate--homocysteine methyltransferase
MEMTMHTVLRGSSREVTIGVDKPFVMIGEKINPTGNKKLAAALQAGDLDVVVALAQKQVAWGADVLDINVGVPGLDEISVISTVVRLLSQSVDVAFCIDSGKTEILAAGLGAAPGKPLVNSVNAEKKQLDTILPIVRDRGAAVIGLTIGDAGIPKTPEERVAAADTIIRRASQTGIPIEDILIDPLVMTVGSDSRAALVTLQTIELLRKEFGVNINLGASNVSFGLPDRETFNQAFLSMAMQAGATCAITDPVKLGSAIRAGDVLLGRDDYAMRFLKYYRQAEALRSQETATAPQ